MVDFTFRNSCEIVFGRDTECQVGALVKKYGGRKVLLHYGGGSIKKSGLYDRVTEALRREGILFEELGGVQPNPVWSLVLEGVSMCRERGLDFILAVGGGSVIDSAKAIATKLVYDGDLWADCFIGLKKVTNALPVGTVLTIPAAGSEMSESMVITREEVGFKAGAGGQAIIPVFSILNPVLTYTLPPYQVACGAADMLAHMMERYFTQVRHVTVSDRMLEGAMKSVVKLAPLAQRQPENYDIRAELMWAGTVAHNNFLGCGRIGDWASHGMEHQLSALYGIAHGAGLAIVIPAWMKYVCESDMARFARFATHVMDIDPEGKQEHAVVAEGISALEAFYAEIGLPTRFSEAGIPSDHVDELSRMACIKGPVGRFQPLEEEDIKAIYKLAL